MGNPQICDRCSVTERNAAWSPYPEPHLGVTVPRGSS